jgi:hypothetical protein
LDWADEEPGLKGAAAELARLKRRAVARPISTLLVALVATLAVVGMRARKVRTFSSRVVFRVTEGDLDASTSPRPAKRLREYVLDVAFSNQRLLDVIREHGLYPRELKRDPSFAVDAMRDDIEVDVWRNYFVEIRQLDDAGRSARIAVTYRARDPKLALEVVRHLGRLIAEQEERARIAMAEDAARQAEAAVAEARGQLERRQKQALSHEVELRRGNLPQQQAALLRVELADLKKNLEPLEARLKDLEQKKASYDLRAAMERNQLGLQFELVDPGQPARLGISKPRELILIGVLVFVFVLPLAGIFVGAYDQRVYDADDVRRLGMEAVGHVERFPGDNVGALDTRLERDHRVH